MARVSLPITASSVSGTAQPSVTAGNSAEGHFLAENHGDVMIEALNEDASATHTVTIRAAKQEAGGFKVENQVVTLAKKGEAGAVKLIGPLAEQVVNQSSGQVFIDVSSNEVKFRAYRV